MLSLWELTNEKSNQLSRGRSGASGCDGEEKVRKSERQSKEE